MNELSVSTERVIDGTQFANWSEEIFLQMRRGGVAAVHVTVAYHENFRQTVDLLVRWNWLFREFEHLIAFAGSRGEIEMALANNRIGILFGLQNPSPIEGDIGLVEILHRLGIRFMQLSYNNQSLLCSGWTEATDSGLTNMGREVVREMNRLGMVIDMSHSAERSTLDAIAFSSRPVVVSHGNRYSWRQTQRNKSDKVLQALAESGGLLGVSLYPGHMKDGPSTTIQSFSEMVASLVDLIGVEHVGLGSDLCQGQPPSVLAWMREGRWRFPTMPDSERPAFPQQPSWFRSNLDFGHIREGLRSVGFTAMEVERIMWRNWFDFLDNALEPQAGSPIQPNAATLSSFGEARA